MAAPYVYDARTTPDAFINVLLLVISHGAVTELTTSIEDCWP